jgi:tRNA-specific 2-thiouridylase
MGITLAQHLDYPHGKGALARAPHQGAAGGAVCGDLVKLAVRIEGDRVAEAGFEAAGCAAAQAAGSATVELVEGAPLLEAALVGPDDVARALGGLVPAKRHAAELAADALHRALGAAARDGVPALAANPRRTLVAMSGGVDSAAAAQLALDAGDEAVAVTLELWSDPATDGEKSCCSPQAVVEARALARRMGIPHFTLDLRDRFRAEVVDDFLSEYQAGRTPNPCVRCNGFVRFDAMLALAAALGAGRLATGHYARIARDSHGPLLRLAADPAKDQTYMLARVKPGELERLAFPLGGLTKPAVRALARDAGLPVADKRESQDLCFLSGVGRRRFVRRRIDPRDGEVVSREGRVLARHDGHEHFTVGQRRGLGVAAPEPLYVVEKDAARNRVVVGRRSDLDVRTVGLRDTVLYRHAEAVDAVKLRYRQSPLACRLTGEAEVTLESPAQAVAPGQTACLLSGDHVVGAGTIERSAR